MDRICTLRSCISFLNFFKMLNNIALDVTFRFFAVSFFF